MSSLELPKQPHRARVMAQRCLKCVSLGGSVVRPVLPGGSRGEAVSWLFHVPGLVAPRHPAAPHLPVCLSVCPVLTAPRMLTLLPPSYKDPRDDVGPTQILRVDLPISGASSYLQSLFCRGRSPGLRFWGLGCGHHGAASVSISQEGPTLECRAGELSSRPHLAASL